MNTRSLAALFLVHEDTVTRASGQFRNGSYDINGETRFFSPAVVSARTVYLNFQPCVMLLSCWCLSSWWWLCPWWQPCLRYTTHRDENTSKRRTIVNNARCIRFDVCVRVGINDWNDIKSKKMVCLFELFKQQNILVLSISFCTLTRKISVGSTAKDWWLLQKLRLQIVCLCCFIV